MVGIVFPYYVWIIVFPFKLKDKDVKNGKQESVFNSTVNQTP